MGQLSFLLVLLSCFSPAVAPGGRRGQTQTQNCLAYLQFSDFAEGCRKACLTVFVCSSNHIRSTCRLCPTTFPLSPYSFDQDLRRRPPPRRVQADFDPPREGAYSGGKQASPEMERDPPHDSKAHRAGGFAGRFVSPTCFDIALKGF